MSHTSKLLAGVELGGTKCVCILGTGPDDVRAIERLPTGNEREHTMRQIESVLERWRTQHGAARALGIASFGPVDLRAGFADLRIHHFHVQVRLAQHRRGASARRQARRCPSVSIPT